MIDGPLKVDDPSDNSNQSDRTTLRIAYPVTRRAGTLLLHVHITAIEARIQVVIDYFEQFQLIL